MRVWLPVALVVAAVVVLVVRRDQTGLATGITLLGGALSVWLMNWLFRVGVSGDRERRAEEVARELLDAHGRWPTDEELRDELERREA